MAVTKRDQNRRVLIPYSTQDISLRDRLEVFRALNRPFLTQGPAVGDFESAVCSSVQASYGVAVNSATSALHVACLALGLGDGDFMWTSPISFVASANCGLYCQAQVDFVDVDPNTWNMSPVALEAKLVESKKRGTLPKVVVVVHLAGEPAELEKIHSLSLIYGFKIIEDASHALGSNYKTRPIGCGEFSDITVFSFHAVKNMTTGEGGMAVTNDPALASKMRKLRSHGITRNPDEFLSKESFVVNWHYEQQLLGFNYRITDFQAALGLSQLRRLSKFNNARREVWKQYKSELAKLGVRFQRTQDIEQSACHLAIVRIPAASREAVVRSLTEGGFASSIHYSPIHLHPFHGGKRRNDLSESEKFYSEAVSIPCFPGLKSKQVRKVVSAISSALSAA
jgi:UDP-4-amino-4,6-dideoxy-N-acetyl-beta-L-altrosamine transaminase